MPQLDASFYASQLFWLLVVFGLLYSILSLWFLPRVRAILEERRAMTEGRRARAAHDAEEAGSLLASHEESLEKARGSARAAAAEIRAQAEARMSARAEEMRASLEARIEAGEASLEKSQRAARSQLEEAAAEAVREIAAHLTDWKPSEDEARKAVARARAS